MNFMQKCKRNGGFTLVELIVVIAILAILAGVAVPAYTGYIKKAEEAADQQLLGAVNTAFAAACLEEGKDVNDVNRARILVTDKKVVAVTDVDFTNDVTKVNEAFLRYFAGNTETQFKVLTNVVYDAAKKCFVDGNSESITVSYAGNYISVSGAAAQALTNSSFMSATMGGSAGLLNKVNDVTVMAQGMAGGALSAVFNDDNFEQTAMKALGATNATEYGQKTAAIIADIMKANEDNPAFTQQDAINQMNANAAVLYAAQNAVGMTSSDISAIFTAEGVDTIKNNLKTDGKTNDGMAQAALVYGMYTAYANSSEYGSDALRANAENPIEVLNALKNDGDFLTYVNSAQGKTDMDAYMGALDMITDSASSSPDAVSDLMVNGFANDQLKGILAGLTGK